jgi:membrane peptidoglycan carboxypeptidase
VNRLRRHRARLDTAGRGPRFWRRLPRRWRRVITAGLAAFVAVCLILGALVGYAAATLPNLDDIGKATGTITVLDVKGRVIAQVGHNNRAHKDVQLSQIAPVMQKAQLAAEDRNFYNEGAFNFGRIVKALFVDVIARRPQQGASTITQQLAKLAFFTQNGNDVASKSFLRKLREAMVANQLDQRYSKDQILDMYLNLVYYGHGAYGIEDAAQTYFGKDASQLNLQEASMLAGLPQAPSFYDPYQNPEAAFARQHYVLAGMVDMGAISRSEADAVDPLAGPNNAVTVPDQQQHQQALIADLNNGKQSAATGAAPHFVQYVREQLQQRFADDPALTAGNLTVTTTLNLDEQNLANTSVSKGVAAIGHGANNGALVMLDSHTGDIVAMVGSADFNNATIGGQYNIATADRQPGSSFKPYVYTEAFREGKLRPDSTLDDTAAQSAKLGGVKDFDRTFEGRITAARALLDSRNVPAEQAMTIAGIPQVIDFAASLGISRSKLQPVVGTAIGVSGITMLEHAAGYAAFSNGGHKVTPRSILKVVDGHGNVLVDDTKSAPQLEQVVNRSDVDTTTKILLGYASRWGLHFNRQTAGKSGTTDNFVDAWYMTYTPQLVVASWAGHTESNHPGELGMQGVFGTTGPGLHIAVPFINGLRDSKYPPVQFQLTPGQTCTSGGSDAAASGCPTPSPSSSPTASPSSSPTPSPTPLLSTPPPPTLRILPGTPTPSPSSGLPQAGASPSP